jgi:hypothetical protein
MVMGLDFILSTLAFLRQTSKSSHPTDTKLFKKQLSLLKGKKLMMADGIWHWQDRR